MSDITSAIEKGNQFLQTQQQPDGSFISFSSPDPIDFSHTIAFHSVFSNAVILLCCNIFEETKTIKQIKDKLVSFLLTEKTIHWTWNYWTRHSKESKAMPYPDDLDDTFCALAALYKYDASLISGEVLAHAINSLIACEIYEGGPYKTWIISATAEKVWQDVDLTVNANIAYFLSLVGVELPSLTALFETAIQKKQYSSPYYPFPYPVIYFLSRFYADPQLKKFLLVKQNKQSTWDNPLHTALAVNSLLMLKVPAKKILLSVQYILSQQQKNGSWDPFAFYTGINPARDKTYFASSPALTTACCLEALNRYKKSLENEQKPKVMMNLKKETIVYEAIIKYIEKYCEMLGNPLQEKAREVFQEIQKKEKSIFLLPYIFTQALSDTISDAVVIQCGIANVFGWIAYTIYDNFLDEEGDISTLSLANVCLRKLTEIYIRVLPKNNEFSLVFQDIMNTLDNANTWEVTQCRLPVKNKKIIFKNNIVPEYKSYLKISQKSFGHALGPLAILFLLGYTKKSEEVKNITRFFHHYLIAKQVNDDAHDVFEDVAKGYCTPVVKMLLQDYQKKYPNQIAISISSSQLKKIFWKSTIEKVHKQIFLHTTHAKKSIQNISLIKKPEILTNLLIPCEKAATKALEERDRSVEFMKSIHF